MKKICIAFALITAFFATAGQLSHPANPLTIGGSTVPIVHKDLPFPICPPDCDQDR